MNKAQKTNHQISLNNEKEILERLRYTYDKALFDVEESIRNLEFTIGDMQETYDWMDDNDPKKAVMKSKIQSKIYQKQYQQQLQKQLDGVLSEMHRKGFVAISEYLDTCYTDGFIGSIFDLHSQNVPLMIPLDQKAMVKAIQLDSPIKRGLYNHLGENVDVLKKHITAQVSRGIATDMSYAQVAKQISGRMVGTYNNPGGSLAYAQRIARTEGHRVQNTAAMDAAKGAVARGADLVKQWDATLDGKTRESHSQVDMQIREIDEKFSNGLMFPGDPSGGAAEVVNCRCRLAQRARWALKEKINPDTGEVTWEDDAFTKFDRESGKIVDFGSVDEYKKFKEKYLKAVSTPTPTQTVKTIADCVSVAEVENLLKSQRWFSVQTLNGKVFDTNEGCSLTGIDLECAKSIYNTHEKLFTRYPQLIGKLNGINTQDLSGLVYAQCHVGFGHGGISVNTRHFADAVKLAKSYARDLATGFHPLGTTYDSIVMHELGHAIDDYMTNTLRLAGMKNHWSPKYVSAELRPKVMRKCGLKVSDVRAEVSEYATKDHFEWFAECFAEHMDSDSPRAVATEFGKQFEELMKKVK